MLAASPLFPVPCPLSMARTTQQQLDAVDAKIEKIEALLDETTGPMAEFVTIDSKRFKRAEIDRLLQVLYTQRDKLQSRLDAETGTRFSLAEPFAE